MPLWKQALLARTYRAPAGDDGADDGAGGAGEHEPTEEEKAAAAKAAAGEELSEEEKAAAAAAAEKAKKAKGSKVSDAEAALIKENMKKKADLKKANDELATARAALAAFDGLDASELKQLVADKKAAEEKALAAKGDFDSLKKRMADEHAVAMKAIVDENTGLKTSVSGLQSQIVELTVGQSFAGSKFIAEETVLTPSKARKVYGEHVDVVDGEVVTFDKARGAKNRTALVDQYGNNLPFETAIAKLVEMDPDKDHVLKNKGKPGAGSGSQGHPAKKGEEKPTDGLGKIQAGLGALFPKA